MNIRGWVEIHDIFIRIFLSRSLFLNRNTDMSQISSKHVHLAPSSVATNAVQFLSQLWNKVTPTSESVLGRIGCGCYSLKELAQHSSYALTHIRPARLTLSTAEIDKARNVALKAMKEYSLDRALEAHPDFDKSKPFSDEKAAALKAEISALIEKEFEPLLKGEGEHAQNFEQALNHYISNAHASFHPETLFVVGGFAAGKSTLESIAKEQESGELKSTGKLLNKAKDFEFKRDVWPYIPSYYPNDHKATFWKIRPLHAGMDSAIRSIVEDKKITRKEGTSLTPSIDDPKTKTNSINTLKDTSRNRKITMVGVFVSSPEIALNRAQKRAEETGRELKPNEVRSTNGSLTHMYKDYLPYVSSFKLFSNDQENTAPVLVAEKQAGELVPVKGQEAAFQAFLSLPPQ